MQIARWQDKPKASLAQLRAQIVISLSGIDETVTQARSCPAIFTRRETFLWNHQLVDIIHETGNGESYIDFFPLP